MSAPASKTPVVVLIWIKQIGYLMFYVIFVVILQMIIYEWYK